MKIKQLITLCFIALLAACSFPVSPGAAEPTQDINQTLDAARTQAALTVAAEIASRATATQPPTVTLAPSATELPSSTPAPTLPPTNTLPPPATATNTFIPFTPTITNTPTPSDYTCSITFSAPANNAQFGKKDEFDAKWTLKNVGTQSWTVDDLDFRYLSGEKMQKFNDIYDLSKNVATNESIDFIVDMIAPDATGTFKASWGLMRGSRTVCTLNVSIVVK
jgi:hypothetical protein